MSARYFNKWPLRQNLHVPFIVILEIIILILFTLYVRFDVEPWSQERWNTYNPLFNDVHVMVFLGIGFLLTFLKNYSLTAICFNFIIGSFCVQWHILVSGFVQHWHQSSGETVITLTLESFLYGEYAAATVLVSFCVVLGKVTICQLFIMAVFEVVLFTVNEYIGRSVFLAYDVGDTIFLHVFAAFYGLGVSRALFVPSVAQPAQLSTSRPSNAFSLLGTLFLWVFWPSFMASASLPGLPQQRAMMNTYLGKRSINIGGVAIAAIADILLEPYIAVLLGLAGGLLCTLGFLLLPDLMTSRLRTHDTCSVHSLHGLTGILGGLASALYALGLQEESYQSDWARLFPGLSSGETGVGGQAVAQLCTLGTTIAISGVGGLLTGAIMRKLGAIQFSGEDVICPQYQRFSDHSTFLEPETEAELQSQGEHIEL